MPLFTTVMLILFVAALGQSAFGFGAGLIAIPLLSLILSMKDAIVLSLLLQLSLGILVVFSYKELDWKSLRWLLTGFIPGTLVGTLLLGTFSEAVLRSSLAILIVLFLMRAWFFQHKEFPFFRTALGAVGAGLLGGLIQGLMGASGPILVMYLCEVDIPKERFRTSLLLLLCLSNLLRVAMAAPIGMFSEKVWSLGMWSIPVVVLAMGLGSWVNRLLDERVYRVSIHVILVGSLLALLSFWVP